MSLSIKLMMTKVDHLFRARHKVNGLFTFIYLFLISSLRFGVADAKQFRSDYKYIEEINGWVKLHRVPTTWYDARLKCRLEDGSLLVSPTTEQIKNNMIDIISDYNIAIHEVYTGINSINSVGDYFTIDGIPLRDINISWAQGEPNNYQDKERCVSMYNDGTIKDIACSEVLPYICYKKDTNDMILTNCGTIDQAYKYDKRTGSCYKIHSVARSWERGFMTCTAEGGYLTILNSPTEAQVIKELLAKVPDKAYLYKEKNPAFVGFNDWGEHGIWMTIHGQTLEEAGFAKWASQEPNNLTDAKNNWFGQFCGALDTSEFGFNDFWCEKQQPFICEKDPSYLAVKDGS